MSHGLWLEPPPESSSKFPTQITPKARSLGSHVNGSSSCFWWGTSHPSPSFWGWCCDSHPQSCHLKWTSAVCTFILVYVRMYVTYLLEWNAQLANPHRHLCIWGPSAFVCAQSCRQTPCCIKTVDTPQSHNRWRWGASPGTADSQRKAAFTYWLLTSALMVWAVPDNGVNFSVVLLNCPQPVASSTYAGVDQKLIFHQKVDGVLYGGHKRRRRCRCHRHAPRECQIA